LTDPGFQQTANSLLVVAGGAFTVPLLARKIKLPASVGEILFGVLVGHEVLNLVHPGEFINMTAELGFLLLMFIAGLELDFRKLEAGGAGPLLHGVGVTLSVFVLALLAAVGLGFDPFLGLVGGAISIGIPLVLLQETGLGRTPFGQNLMLVGSIGEFASILLVTAVAAYDHSGGINAAFAFELGELALIFFGAYIVLAILRTMVWWRSESFSRVVESHDPSEIGVRGGLFLMFFFVAVAAKFQIDPILGSFLAGALFSFVFRGKGPLEMKFMSIGNGFFVPFFFISVGLHFSIEKASGGDLLLLFKLLLVMVSARIIAFAIVPKRDKTLLNTVGGGLLLSAPLTLLVVVANLGQGLGKIDDTMHATVILLAVISSTIYPFCFKLLVPKLLASPDGVQTESGH
jgi:Kef-type K+ transport system membrane component KefB